MNKATARAARLMPNGIPRYVRCYDNGGATADRYTVVYTGNYPGKPRGVYEYVGMNSHPFHPLGFGQHGESQNGPIDRPSYGHLGKRIAFNDLPDDCKRLVLSDYRADWGLSADKVTA
jgi:hypothetical protein